MRLKEKRRFKKHLCGLWVLFAGITVSDCGSSGVRGQKSKVHGVELLSHHIVIRFSRESYLSIPTSVSHLKSGVSGPYLYGCWVTRWVGDFTCLTMVLPHTRHAADRDYYSKNPLVWKTNPTQLFKKSFSVSSLNLKWPLTLMLFSQVKMWWEPSTCILSVWGCDDVVLAFTDFIGGEASADPVSNAQWVMLIGRDRCHECSPGQRRLSRWKDMREEGLKRELAEERAWKRTVGEGVPHEKLWGKDQFGEGSQCGWSGMKPEILQDDLGWGLPLQHPRPVLHFTILGALFSILPTAIRGLTEKYNLDPAFLLYGSLLPAG